MGAEALLLGPLQVHLDGASVVLSGAKQRCLVARLALSAGHVVPAAALVEALWGDDPPDRAEHTLQQHVSAVRKAFATAAESTQGALRTHPPGYALDADVSDLAAFEQGVDRARDAVAAERWPDARAELETALGLWRGAALVDARDGMTLEALALRLDEQRIAALELSYEVRLGCGETVEVVAELQQLVADHPLREGARALLMLALYRAGRQVDALSVFRAGREALVEELGLEPGIELRELEQAILMQSPSLDRARPRPAREVQETFRAGSVPDVGRLEFADGQAVLLAEGSVMVGRDPSAGVCLVDNRVSRTHAEIVVTLDGVTVRDLGSTNGTAVNGVPVSAQQRLEDGDVVSVGGVELRFRSGASG